MALSLTPPPEFRSNFIAKVKGKLRGLVSIVAATPPNERPVSSISAIAVSGMNAATRRLEVSASNVANVMTTGALPATNGTVATGPPQAYQPLRLNETASANGGTQTSVTAAAPSYVAISDPQAPFANQNGLVAAPNVDISQEMINQMIASYSFTANAGVLKAEDLMTKTLLDTTA
jgi:flagellar basal-body rod protein FlgC